MMYFKKTERPTNGGSCKCYRPDFEGVCIIGSFERSEGMKNRRNAVRVIAVIGAVCVALAAAEFVKCRSAEKPEV